MLKRTKYLFPSLLLILTLLLSMSTPVCANENNENEIVDAAIIFADLHTKKPANINNPSEFDLEQAYKKAEITNIMNAIAANIKHTFSSVTSAGDAFSVCNDYDDDYFLQSHTGNTGKINKYIREGLGTYADDTLAINYVWSDHDRDADIFNPAGASAETLNNLLNSGFVYGAGADGKLGTSDDGNYYIYALSMADTSTALRYGLTSRDENQVKTAIANFKDLAETLDKTNPLFIVAHQPLFDRRDDNGHAYLWYEAIYEIAETMDVAYFFGHNHDWDEESDYYYPKTTNPEQPVIMTVGCSNDKNGITYYEKPLNFTHICAGYMSPTTQDEKTREGIAIGITIYDDYVRYAAYDKNGLYKNEDNRYTLDVEVKRMTPPEPSVAELDLKNNRPYYVAASAVLNNYTGYKVTLPSPKMSAKVTLPRPLPGSEVPLAVYKLSDDGNTLTKISTAKDALKDSITFTTSSSGIYFIGTDLYSDEYTDTPYNAGTIPSNTGTNYRLVNSFENGAKYLLVGENGIYGTPIAYVNNNGNEGYGEVSIMYSETSINNPNAVWTATGDDQNGYQLSNNGYYLGGEKGNTLKTSSSEAVRLTYNASDVRLHTTASKPMYFYYSTSENEQWKFIESKNSSNSSSSRRMWIFKEVPVCTMHAYTSTSTAPSDDSCGWTTNTCAICDYSNVGNFTSPDTALPKASISLNVSSTKPNIHNATINGVTDTDNTSIANAPDNSKVDDSYATDLSNSFALYQDYHFVKDNEDVRCYYKDGKPVINEFKCDGTYTYYFQADGTAMRDCLTYHPDGEHVIYFDKDGHEVFSNFANVKKTISGESVDDYCFFDANGYLYVNVVTYDQTGTHLYYANPYGVIERGKWFEFSDDVKWADGTPFDKAGGKYGYANADGTLKINTWIYDWEGRYCYLQGNGVAKY